MWSPTTDADLAAVAIGSAARAALRDGARGRVIAAFRRSFYVQMEGEGLACIGPPELGAGPLNVLCDPLRPIGGERVGRAAHRVRWGPGVRPGSGVSLEATNPTSPRPSPPLWGGEGAPGLAEGAPVQVSGGCLVVEALCIGLDGAEVWEPAPVTWSPAAAKEAFARVAATAAGRLPAEGLAPLVFAGRTGDAVTRRAAPAVAALESWLREGGDVPRECAGLIGLGPGLTPSGDDVVGGLMVALRSLGRQDAADRLAAWVLPVARERTNVISDAHLAAAAGGEGSAALHGALAALAAGDGAALAKAVDALAAIGHVSGWDGLAGAALAFRGAAS